jgi:hypothetical protein
MATIDGPKYTGALTVDLSNVASKLIDLAPGAMKGIRGEQEGIDNVKKELAESMSAHAEAADIPAHVYQRFLERTALLEQLREKERELRKLVEILEETRAKTENDREDDISIIAKAAQSAADRRKDPGVAAPFEATIRYNSQIADKALQTRRKNAEAKAEKAKSSAVEGELKPPVQGG